jgi:hypothetical protein
MLLSVWISETSSASVLNKKGEELAIMDKMLFRFLHGGGEVNSKLLG